MTLISGLTSLQDLIDTAKDFSDMENNPVVSTTEWVRYANLAYSQLYDLLIEKYAENYPNSTPYVFVTDGVNQQYKLPPDFYKKIGLDVQYSGGPQGWITVHDTPFAERNRYSYPFNVGPPGYFNYHSRLVGNTIMLLPLPQGSITFRLWYAPRLTTLALNGIVTLNQVVGQNVGSGIVGDTFTFNPNWSPTIQPPTGAVLPAAGNSITFTAIAGASFANQFTVVTGDMITTASNFAAAINSSVLNSTYGIVAQAIRGTSQVSIIPATSGSTVSWTSSNAGHFQLNLPPVWTCIFDAISGWDKFVALEMAIMAMVKQNLDVSDLQLERAQEVARIESAAAIRSADEPNHVVNRGSRGGGGWGSGENGGGWGGC